ncbi:hypothetical protein F5H01DRAFT_358075 [Linnemannia elongata]|nr:hypothetical protein F5H01DRAFT_358075 [Linnemannia elongata]
MFSFRYRLFAFLFIFFIARPNLATVSNCHLRWVISRIVLLTFALITSGLLISNGLLISKGLLIWP